MKYLIIFFLASLLCLPLSASHFLGGEITTRFTGGLTIEITLITYTDPSAAGVDRCYADIEIWNATGSVLRQVISGVPRSNGPLTDPLGHTPPCGGSIGMGDYVEGSIKKNIYVASYTFSGPGEYLVRHTDPSRWDGLINMTSSGTESATLETLVLISAVISPNSTPVFDVPLFTGCINSLWVYDTGLYDADGDSIVVFPSECKCYDIAAPGCAGFSWPDSLGGGYLWFPDDTTVMWDHCLNPGGYAYAFYAEEYRHGIRISYTHVERTVFMKTSGCTVDAASPVADTPVSLVMDDLNHIVEVRSELQGNFFIKDVQGKSLITDQPFSGNFTFSTEGLSPGLYFLTLWSEERIVSRKFMIRH